MADATDVKLVGAVREIAHPLKGVAADYEPLMALQPLQLHRGRSGIPRQGRPGRSPSRPLPLFLF
jgi:hypothetical protein